MGYSPWGCKELDMTEQLTHICRYIQNIHKTPTTQQQKPRMQFKNRQINIYLSIYKYLPKNGQINFLSPKKKDNNGCQNKDQR